VPVSDQLSRRLFQRASGKRSTAIWLLTTRGFYCVVAHRGDPSHLMRGAAAADHLIVIGAA
jgi:hypothetical protein